MEPRTARNTLALAAALAGAFLAGTFAEQGHVADTVAAARVQAQTSLQALRSPQARVFRAGGVLQ